MVIVEEEAERSSLTDLLYLVSNSFFSHHFNYCCVVFVQTAPIKASCDAAPFNAAMIASYGRQILEVCHTIEPPNYGHVAVTIQ